MLLLVSPILAAPAGVYHFVQVVDENGETVTDISTVSIYLPGTTTNAILRPAVYPAVFCGRTVRLRRVRGFYIHGLNRHAIFCCSFDKYHH